MLFLAIERAPAAINCRRFTSFNNIWCADEGILYTEADGHIVSNVHCELLNRQIYYRTK